MYTETRHIPYRIKEESLNGCRFDVDFQGVLFEDLEISMAGEHQVKNAVAALAALCILEERGEIRVPRTALYAGFRKARQPGRLETAGYTGENDAIPVILDGAHNPDGARVLRNAMNRFCGGKKILLVTGMLVDKDVKTEPKFFRWQM